MRRLILLAAAIGVLSPAMTYASNLGCPVGSRQTLVGQMEAQPMLGLDGRGWVYIFEDEELTPCAVAKLRGKGPVPKSCAKGGKFSAEGQVVKRGAADELQVTRIQCGFP